MPILICHVVWMPQYAGEDEVHPGGFDYVRDEGFGYELFNFKPIGGVCYGFVQVRTGVINITRLGANRSDTFFDGATVMWTAPHPNGERVVVGWYHDARVYRNLQVGRLKDRHVAGQPVGYLVHAPADKCALVPANKRDFAVPHNRSGVPGQSSVFYPEGSSSRDMAEWLERARRYISSWNGPPVGSQGGAPGSGIRPSTQSGGWRTSPDSAHNAAVEAAAVAFVRERLGKLKKDRQKDNCGWDLEFRRGGRTLCVEIKGISGSEIDVELTPNEYKVMKQAMTGSFDEGDYRLAVVCNALTSTPKLFLFAHESGMNWVCELTSRRIKSVERTAARLG